MAGHKFISNFYSIPLGDYDTILGVQWLQEVSPVSFDFNRKEIIIQSGEKRVTIVQTTTRHAKFYVDLEKERVKDCGPQACFLVQLTVVETENAETKMVIPSVQEVLDMYPEIFSVPNGLPPARIQDRMIPIIDGCQPVNLNPYKCSYL